jgi:hypothetical protein
MLRQSSASRRASLPASRGGEGKREVVLEETADAAAEAARVAAGPCVARPQRGFSAAAAPAAAAAAKAMEKVLDDIVVVLEMEAWSMVLVVLALW